MKVELAPGVLLYLDLLKKTLTGSLYDESAWQILDSQMPKRTLYAFFREIIIKALRKRSLILVKTRHFDKDKRDGGIDWPMIGYTMVGMRRLDNLQTCVQSVLKDDVPGDFVECGVWRGGASIFVRALFKVHDISDRKVWLADSFQGMPVPKEHDVGDPDLSYENYLKVSLDSVKNNFRRFDLLDNQVQFLKGWFSDSLPHAPIDRISILRLDGDHFSSTMDALTSLYGKVSVGGYVIIDDYYAFPSCSVAVSQFFRDQGIDPELNRIDTLSVYWQRTASRG
jgi:hypothetical protein